MVPPSMLRRWTLWSYRFLINAFNRSEVIKSFISGEWYTVSSLKNAKCSRNFHCNIGVNHLWFSKDQEIWLFFKLCYIGSKFIKQQQYLCRFKIFFFSIRCINLLKNANLWYIYMKPGSIVFSFDKCIQLFLRISQMFKVIIRGSEWTYE